jgi:hypothetical protein
MKIISWSAAKNVPMNKANLLTGVNFNLVHYGLIHKFSNKKA